ncbi:MAG: transposase, partial [Armatimonadia bacterium]
MPSDNRPPSQHRLRLGRESVAGRCYHVTITCANHQRLLHQDRIRQLVAEAIQGMLGRGFGRLDAYVIMPDHIHILFSLADTKSLSQAIQDLKKFTALRANRLLGREGSFWNQGFHDHAIRTDRDYSEHLAYILRNPVRAGLVKEGEQYPYLGWGPWEM